MPSDLRFARFLDRFVDRQVEDAGHGAHFFADALAGANEQRINERFGRKPGFADKVAHRLSTAQTAQAVNREVHGS